MTAVVIDTNVLVVANGGHHRAGPSCQLACITALLEAQTTGVLVDDGGEIFGQYRRNASHSGQPGVGDAFWKWLWDHQADEDYCLQIVLARNEHGEYEHFPVDAELARFDRSDRVFVALAIASGIQPQVLNASDTDWWHARDALRRNGVQVAFLCPELMR